MLERGSNEAEILAILEALRILRRFNCGKGPWRFQFILNEIKSLSSSIPVTFSYVSRSANFIVDALAKQVVVRILALEASLL